MVSEDRAELAALVVLAVSEEPAAQVACVELARGQAAVPELELVQVEPELERGPVVALERELDQVAVELVRGIDAPSWR